MPDKQLGLDAFIKGDYHTAYTELRPVAEEGDTLAQYKVGTMFARGWGVNRDHKESLNWFQLAADKGHPESQAELGGQYERGFGVAQDFAQATTWYQRAAAQGEPTAQFALGNLYRDGRGVEQDPLQAHKWFALSQTGGFDGGTSGRLMIEKDLSEEQIAEAQQLAAAWEPTLENAAPA